MHIPDRQPAREDEHLLPLINIIFLLLIFFMLVSSLTVIEILSVEPPDSLSKTDNLETEANILMNSAGELALNNQSILTNELVEQIRQRISVQPDLVINLKVDGRLPAQSLVSLSQTLKATGAQRLRLVTRGLKTSQRESSRNPAQPQSPKAEQ
ncbi:MAG: ExbD/TolR family protein [Oceanobacter sp.]